MMTDKRRHLTKPDTNKNGVHIFSHPYTTVPPSVCENKNKKFLFS
jgi:hypothetical protein